LTKHLEGSVVLQFNAVDGFFFYEDVNKVETVTDAYIKLELKSP